VGDVNLALRVALTGTFAFLLISPASAASSPSDIANEISAEIMSPYCPGVTLHDCPSDQAIALRSEIEGWARGGMTEAQIKERLVDEFGANVLASPPASGFNLLAWLLPALAIAAAAAAGWLVTKRWTSRPAIGSVEPSSEDRTRVRAELDILRRAREDGS
jgi:cytochrome c-type biogenesis protein CcmH